MSIYTELTQKETKLSVIGLGYVGMPIAVAFAEHLDVVGFDINQDKIQLYQDGIDPTHEVGDEAIQETSMRFTSDEEELQEAKFHVVAVPTPIKIDKTPDLTPILAVTEMIGRNLQPGSVVVYESTVYPGVTEDVCVPLLEEVSGMTCGEDFAVGYSPERINPGDKVHTLETITKIVSATDDQSLEEIAKVYELVVKAGIHKTPSIKVAEAAKVVENSQRDINIAFMNELALVFDRMGIDTQDVLEAMNTKWNALGFTPGLVGGHCIGVDPYYFIYQAENLGYHSQIIAAGRQINNEMGNFVAEKIIKKLVQTGKRVKDAKVGILGITFKEHTPDTRNSKVADIVTTLRDYGLEPVVADPWADRREAEEEYQVEVLDFEDLADLDCVVLAVAHDEFRQLSMDEIDQLFAEDLPRDERVIIDVKSTLDAPTYRQAGYEFWRL